MNLLNVILLLVDSKIIVRKVFRLSIGVPLIYHTKSIKLNSKYEIKICLDFVRYKTKTQKIYL